MFIIPTIDAEGVHGNDPFNQMMLGDVGGESNFGALKIAEIFNRYGISATFFVDVYEHTLFGEDLLKKLCNNLLKLNQDVQLHTHPAWRDDPRDFAHVRKLKREKSFFPQQKDFMCKCSFEEQVGILKHGLDCLERWCGVRPVAHRAGGYGLNQDTILALSETGIPVDSSMYYGHTNSKITWSMNSVVEKDGVVEVPVTGFRRLQTVSCLGMKKIRDVPFFKTDLDFCSAEELMWYLGCAKENGLKVLNLFMHSYSLLNFDFSFRWFRPDRQALDKLDRFISKTINRAEVTYLSMSDFYRRFRQLPELFLGSDDLPVRESDVKAISLAVNKMKKLLFSRYNRIRNGNGLKDGN